MSVIIKLDPENPEKEKIKRVVRFLEEGKIVVYPTDTAYAMGVDVESEESLKKLRKIKQRLESPFSTIVSNIEMAEKYGYLNDVAKKLIQEFMPGPLTLIVKKKDCLSDLVNKDGFSFRIPGNVVALNIVKELGRPITAPSANPKGKEPPYSVEEAIRYFGGSVDVYVDVGKLRKIPPSTIVDVREKKIELIREGPIPFEKILKTIRKLR
ncbi:MAG: threonylcarbamoyl-AMP synthase [Candidatus Aenigmarchaeota archaeon]|nr:threonylcarbamoyl-AMP synthase [Candidatus Aenigmarchaeota archaeon]